MYADILKLNSLLTSVFKEYFLIFFTHKNCQVILQMCKTG